MGLNLHIIRHELEDLCTDVRCNCSVSQFPLETSVFLDPESIADEKSEEAVHYIYITDTAQLESVLHMAGTDKVFTNIRSILSGKTLAICGEAPAFLTGLSCDYICVPADIRPAKLLNRISSAFLTYNQWESQLREDHLDPSPIKKMALHSRRILRNPFMILDASFCVLCSYAPLGAENTPQYKTYLESSSVTISDRKYVTIDDINTIMSDPAFRMHETETLPYYFEEKGYGYRTLHCNIRQHNTTLGWLISDEVLVPFTSYDEACMSLFSKQILEALLNRHKQGALQSKAINEVVEMLLSHKLVPEERITGLLMTLNWNMYDTFVCLLLDSCFDGQEKSFLRTLASELNLPFGSFFYTFFGRQIVLVLNLNRLAMNRSDAVKHLLPVFRDSLLAAGISASFSNFKDLYYYYRQAQFSLKNGQKKYPQRWHHQWEDYILDYYVSKCKAGSTPNALMPSGLLRLIDYDRENGTTLVELISVYLANDRNIATSSRLLYLHRNTFIYRLEKAKEILRMNLDSNEVRLTLMVAFHLL